MISRRIFLLLSIVAIIVVGLLGRHHHDWWWLYAVVLPVIALGCYDLIQTQNNILRNFPVIGHLRYLLQGISPELQQYFIERHTDGTPVSENHRNLIYGRSKGNNPTHPFGSELDLYDPRYEALRHSIYPASIDPSTLRVTIGGPHCRQPYSASLLNISALSYGSVSDKAVHALSAGARLGNFYCNTGEGSLSEFHLEGGGNLVWQIGTAYFGCRTDDGDFDPEEFREKARQPNVKMIELKLSQGAKPGHGGVLPAIKNTPAIARARDIEPHTRVNSPPGHRAFSDPRGLIHFVTRLRELCDHKPVGVKLCIGREDEFREICRLMRETGEGPDFFTIDGAEGGTGASPLEYSDSVGMPLEPALQFVHATLQEFGLRDRVHVIASGKILTAFEVLRTLALGADLCNAARAFMLSLGCIQALRCDTNHCPTGVTTQDPKLTRGLVVSEKKHRVANFHRKTIEAVAEMMAASGASSPSEVTAERFLRGTEWGLEGGSRAG